MSAIACCISLCVWLLALLLSETASRHHSQHPAVLHGEDAEDTLTSTNISAADQKKYDWSGNLTDSSKFGKIISFEQAIFNRHCQGQNETVEQFITSLYSLAEYGEVKDQMNIDCIIVRICDQSLCTFKWTRS